VPAPSRLPGTVALANIEASHLGSSSSVASAS
jgi:hypothetical protein